jgi:hypothetical protein
MHRRRRRSLRAVPLGEPTYLPTRRFVNTLLRLSTSLPPSFSPRTVALSQVTMFIAIILTMAFSGAQGRQPTGIVEGEPVRITAWAPPGTTFVEGFNAVLTIIFTWGVSLEILVYR